MKLRILVGVLVSVSLCLGVVLFATGTGASDGRMWFQSAEVTDAYQFPERTGEYMAWNDVIKFMQVPEEVLKSMSTEGLVETCLSYPLYGAMAVSNQSMYAGFLQICEQFNGLQELFQRDDCGAELLKIYKRLYLKKLAHSSTPDTLRIRYFAYILADSNVLGNLKIEGRDELKDACMGNLVLMINEYPNIYSVEPTALIVARILNLDSTEFIEYAYMHANIRIFLTEGWLWFHSEEEVIEFSYFFANLFGV